LSPHEIEMLASGQEFYGAMHKEGCRVVLTGMMGDSLNEGSERLAYDLLRRGRLGETLRRAGHQWRDSPRMAAGALLYYGLLPFAPWPLLRAVLVGLTLREGPYTTLPDCFTAIAGERIAALDRGLRLRPLAGLRTHSPATQLVLAELKPMLAVTSCAHSALDVRHPFIDRRLVEFTLSMAPEQKWDPMGGSYSRANRWHHRRALAHIVPAEVLDQQSGFDFGPAIAAGYRGDRARAWLLDAPAIQLVERDLVRPEGLLGMVTNPSNLHYTTVLLGLEAWLRALAPGGALLRAIPPRKADRAPASSFLRLPRQPGAPTNAPLRSSALQREVTRGEVPTERR
jgi:hypothetical protein